MNAKKKELADAETALAEIPDNEETNAAAIKMQNIKRGKDARAKVQAKR